jgi:GNAT superfamily N-acetyltransferase
MIIRPASEADSEDIRRVERSAGVRFTEIGMEWVASHEPMSASLLTEFAQAGRSWVAEGSGEDADGSAEDSDGRPLGYVEGRIVGYAVVEIVDNCAHIEQLSVDLEHQGQGIGTALIEEVEAFATSRGLGALTLTTFDEVPWNRALYEHLGFSVLAEDQLSAGLREIRQDEAKRGLDPEIRVCMRKMIDPSGATT